MLSDPRVSACIVLYHATGEVLRTVRCLQNATTPVTLFVVDNSPQEPMARQIQAQCRQARIIPMKRNVGFAAANNEALKQLSSTYHLILNPDVTFEPDVIQRMVDFMDAHPDVAILTPRVFNIDGTEQFLPKRRPTIRYMASGSLAKRGEKKAAKARALDAPLRLAEETAAAARQRLEAEKRKNPRALARCLRLERQARRLGRKKQRLEERAAALTRLRAEYTLADDPPTEPMEVQFATGCFLLIRSHLFFRIGGFDPRYFLYQEDSDLSMKVMRYGKIVYHPDMHITHAWHRDSSHSFRHRMLHLVSTIRFFNKWGWKW